MELRINKSMKRDHRQRPHFVSMPFIPIIIHNIIVISVCTFSIEFHAMFWMFIIIMCIPYGLHLLYHAALITYLHYLLSNSISIPKWTTCTMWSCLLQISQAIYDHALTSNSNSLRQYKIWLSLIKVLLFHSKNHASTWTQPLPLTFIMINCVDWFADLLCRITNQILFYFLCYSLLNYHNHNMCSMLSSY